jgi:hypothetical protein
MELRSRFIPDFPPDRISEMQIDDYCVGKIDSSTGEPNRRTFCYRLERKMKGFGGIEGTPSSNFGIYYDKESQDYIYYKSKHDSTEAAFTSIKSEIHSILQAGKQFSVVTVIQCILFLCL